MYSLQFIQTTSALASIFMILIVSRQAKQYLRSLL